MTKVSTDTEWGLDYDETEDTEDDDMHRYGHCDWCGKYMIDDTERGCGRCYNCQAEWAGLQTGENQ
jgi:hypothetical protein